MEILIVQQPRSGCGGRGGPDQDWQPPIAPLLANLINTTTERGPRAVPGPRWYRRTPRTGRFRASPGRRLWCQVCARAAAVGLGDSLCSMAWGPEEREEATPALFYLPGEGPKRWRVDRSLYAVGGRPEQLAPALLSHPDVRDPVDHQTSAALPMKAQRAVVVVRLRGRSGPCGD